MQYAKLDEQNNIIFPTPEDYVDGKLSDDWKEYVSTDKPQETAIRKYSPRYDLVSDEFGGEYKIVQSWSEYVLEPHGRVAKLSGKELVFPSQSETLSDGTLICNFDRLPNSKKLECGYYLLIEAEYPNDGKQYRETGVLVSDAAFGNKIKVVLEEVLPEPESPFDISKLKLKRAMVALGKWEDFLAVLKSSPSAFEDFNLAVSLMSNDPLVLQFKGVCMQMFGFTEEQIDMMLKSCKSDI